MIFVGGGALEAADEVRALAERLGAPVVSYRRGRGVLDDRHPLSHALPGGHALWAKADVVLAVGTRLQLQLANWGTDDKLALIKVDIDPEELDRIRTPEIGLAGDAAGRAGAAQPASCASAGDAQRIASLAAALSRSASAPRSPCSHRSSAFCARSATCCPTTAF